MPQFQKYINLGLQNWQEFAVCQTSVDVVSELAAGLRGDLLPYVNDIMRLLLEDLKNEHLIRDVKPYILTCFSDIALAIGAEFLPHLESVMTVLFGAASSQLTDPEDQGLIDFFLELRIAILESFTGIVHGFMQAQQAQLLNPYIRTMIQVIAFFCADRVLHDPEITRAALCAFGDICKATGPPLLELLQPADWLESALRKGFSSKDPMLQEAAGYAREQFEIIQKARRL